MANNAPIPASYHAVAICATGAGAARDARVRTLTQGQRTQLADNLASVRAHLQK
jgi:hypothetical protein